MHVPPFNHLAEPESPEHYAAALDTICRDIGLQHYLVVRVCGQQLDDVMQVFENAPAESASDVKHLRHWSIARLLQRLRKGGPPVAFGAGAEPGIDLPGYASGVGYFVLEHRGGCFFYLASSAPALPVATVPLFQTLVLAAHHSIQGLSRLQEKSCPLSEKEMDCLQHFLDGHSAKQTAEAMGVTKKTVEHYLASARKRIGVRTTSAAAYKAFDRGWLTISSGGGTAMAG